MSINIGITTDENLTEDTYDEQSNTLYIGSTKTGNIIISDFCLSSYPCQHHVSIKIDDKTEDKRMDGISIYKYCIENNYAVPEHFQGYKKDVDKGLCIELINNHDLHTFKNNKLVIELLPNMYNRQQLIEIATRFNKLDFVKYMIDKLNTEVVFDHKTYRNREPDPRWNHECDPNEKFTMPVNLSQCIKYSTHYFDLEMFKYFLDKTGDIKELEKCCDNKNKETILQWAAQSKNLPLIKYLVETLNVQITNVNDMWKDPLMQTLQAKRNIERQTELDKTYMNHVAKQVNLDIDINECIRYLADLTIQNKQIRQKDLMYDGSCVFLLDSHDLLQEIINII